MTNNSLDIGKCYIIKDGGYRSGIRKFKFSCYLNWSDDCIFKYEGKQGIHHCFRAIPGGWTRTYADYQLIGKKIKEVK